MEYKTDKATIGGLIRFYRDVINIKKTDNPYLFRTLIVNSVYCPVSNLFMVN